MITAILFLVVAGFSWVSVGAAVGHVERQGYSLVRYQFLVCAVCVTLGLVGWVTAPTAFFPHDGCPAMTWILVVAGMLLCGAFNYLMALLMGCAMKRGPNAIVWAIIQSGLIYPFLMGWLIFSVPMGPRRFFGITLIIASVFFYALRSGAAEGNASSGSRAPLREWLPASLLGMLCCGVNQCAANLPSYLEKGRDFSGTFRTFAMYFGLLMAAFVHVGILRLRGHRAEPIRPGELRSLAVWAGSVGLVSFFVGKYLTFPGLDRLERLGAGSMGYPVMVAACIVGFFLYGFFVLRERISARQAIGAVLGIAGILFGCLDSAGGEVALQGGVTTSAPGWTFTEDERPSFAVAAPEQQAGKSKLPWQLLDWRGNEVRQGEWPADGRLKLSPLPPGFYRVEPEGFDFCVVRRDPCRNPDSPFAVDSALSHRAETFDCPWYDGDTFRVVCELMRKCGVAQTRERMVWKGMNPAPGVYDYGRRLANVEHLRANGLVTTGIFAGTPAHAGGEEIGKRHLPTDLMALYTLMTNAVPTFGNAYNAWGFWNEPDLQMVPEPVWEYVAAFKAFALAVRAADPAKPVLLGALSDVPDKDFGGGLVANEFQKYADIFNIHTYLEPARLPDWSRRLRAFLAQCGHPDWAVWLTEFGTNLEGDSTADGVRPGLKAHSPEQEMVWAEWYPKAAILAQSLGIDRSWLFLFGCYNERSGRKDWGTMRRDGSVKPIHAAISTLTGELGDARMLGEVNVGEGVRAFLYSRGGARESGQSDAGIPGSAGILPADAAARQTIAFWSVSEIDTATQGPVHPKGALERPFSLSLSGDAASGRVHRLIDMMGTPLPPPAPAADGTLALVAERYPQYLTGDLGLAPDIPAPPRGRIIRYEAAPGEDLSVVVRPKLAEGDFEIAGHKSRAELTSETGAISVELWNFSGEEKRGRLVVEGGELSGAPAETPESVVLPAWGHVTIPYRHAPSADDPLDATLAFRFESEAGVSTPACVPVFDRHRFLASCEVVPLSLEDPAAWRRNDSGQTYRCTYDEAEKAVRFDVGWTGETGPWFMPWHDLRLPAESFEGAKMIEFEVKSEQDKVENDYNSAVFLPAWADGRTQNIHYPPPGHGWEVRRVALPPDAGGIVSFRLGGAPRGRRLTFWIRNVRLLK